MNAAHLASGHFRRVRSNPFLMPPVILGQGFS
jgi:hypothetical protein